MPRRRITAADLFRIALPNSPTLSPDGKEVAFAVQTIDAPRNRYVSNLYAVPARGGRARPLTFGTAKNTAPLWSPDGKWIAFLSDREKEAGPQIWLLPTGGGEARKLTALEGGPVRELAWSPDGRRLLFGHRIQPKEDPEKKKLRATFKHITRLDHKLDGDGYLPNERWHLWTVAVPGGRAKQVTFGAHDDGGGAWSPDGRRVAFSSNRRPNADWLPGNSDIFIVASTGGKPRQITARLGAAGRSAWSADGRWIYYLGNFARPGEGNRHPTHLYRISASGGRALDLTPRLDRRLSNTLLSDTALAGEQGAVLWPYFDSGEERLAFLVSEHGACRLHSIAAAGGPARVEFGGSVNVLGVSIHARSAQAAVAAARMLDAGDVYGLTLDGSGRSRRLTETNRAFFAGLDLTEPEETLFRNGRAQIHGWILRPPGFRRGRKYPMLLEVHGGPMAQYGYTFFHEIHLLAAQGYVVAFSNPRGSDGYGTRFRCCIDGRWGTDDFRDVMAVVDAMERKPYVDRKRLGILGGSYGGYMTTWAVGHTDRFKAAVTQRQCGNHFSMFGSSDIGTHDFFAYKSYPWEQPLRWLRHSPNFYAGRIRTPLLIIHSEQDLRCPLSQSEELFASLKHQKKVVEFVQFEGESHGLSRKGKPLNRLENQNRIVDWFKRYL